MTQNYLTSYVDGPRENTVTYVTGNEPVINWYSVKSSKQLSQFSKIIICNIIYLEYEGYVIVNKRNITQFCGGKEYQWISEETRFMIGSWLTISRTTQKVVYNCKTTMHLQNHISITAELYIENSDIVW